MHLTWSVTKQFSHTFTLCSKQNRLVTFRFGHLHRPIFAPSRLKSKGLSQCLSLMFSFHKSPIFHIGFYGIILQQSSALKLGESLAAKKGSEKKNRQIDCKLKKFSFFITTQKLDAIFFLMPWNFECPIVGLVGVKKNDTNSQIDLMAA